MDVPVVDHLCGGSTTGTSVLPVAVEEKAKLVYDLGRFAVQAAMGQADDAVALNLPGRVAGSITLEGCDVAVEFDAVGLDDQLLTGPEGVDLMPEHKNVGDRHWQVVFATQGNDSVLKRRARRLRHTHLLNQVTNRPKRPATRTTSTDGFQVGDLKQMQTVCLLRRGLEMRLVHFRKIEKRASDRGDGDRSDCGSIVDGNPTFMKGNARALSSGNRGDFNRSAWVMHQAPERRRTPVAQQRPLATSKHGRQPSPPMTHSPRAPEVHPAMHASKPTCFDAPLDRPHTQAAIQQLAAGDHRVLTSCQLFEPAFSLGEVPTSPPPLTCRFLTTHVVG
jgi:hypothetical protein